MHIQSAAFGLSLSATCSSAVVPAGTPLFHGTRCAGDFEIPDGPAWFAYDRSAAIKWIDWSIHLPDGRRPGERRVLCVETVRDITLLDTRHPSDWHRLCEVLTGDSEAEIHAVARHLAGAADGWMGRNEVLLCTPELWLQTRILLLGGSNALGYETRYA